MAARDTPWNTDVNILPAEQRPADIQGMVIEGVTTCKSYSLRNGNPEDIEPYLLTSAIPEAFHWVPINGLRPNDALRCVDGFIRCYLYRIARAMPVDWDNALARTGAIILGATRAVMMNNYDLTSTDINPQELAVPVLAVNIPAATEAAPNPMPTYTVLLANNSPNMTSLTDALVLTDQERELVRLSMRCAQAIIPIQGLNLINDGHHYLSDRSKQSYKAFLAVEKQLWVSTAMKDRVAANGPTIRDVMWHKAGHPVSVAIKEAAATSPTVKANLEAAKLGSATARLPAVEAEIRAADTYLKMAEAVDAIWASMGGRINVDMLRFRIAAVRGMPRSIENLPRAVDMGGNVMVQTRTAAMNALKSTVAKNSDNIAVAFGFYMATVEGSATDTGDTSADTLRNANSLNRLKRNNVAAYVSGVELYKDYRAVRSAARARGDVVMPDMTLEA